MSLLDSLFGRYKPTKELYFPGMKEYAGEAERTYRGFIGIFNREVASGVLKLVPTVGPAAVSDRGLYLARLFGCSYIVTASAKSGAKPDDVLDFANIASGLAYKFSDTPFDRNEATILVNEALGPMLENLSAAFEDGAAFRANFSPSQQALVKWWHRALAESIGQETYSHGVRERFIDLIEANISTSLNNALRWVRKR